MIAERVAQQYAKALFNMAGSDAQLHAIAKGLDTFSEVLKRTPKFLRFLSNPQLSLEQKEEILLEALGNDKDPILISVLQLMLERNRISCLGALPAMFDKLVDERVGILRVKAATAQPLDAATKAELQAKLEQFYHKSVQITEEVDPALVGGAVITMGTHMIDSSVRGRLAKIKESLLSMRV